MTQWRSLAERMVREQIMARGVRSEAVLQAMRTVPRHLFVDEALRESAWIDSPLPIGEDQTISQPYMVARMTELLEIAPGQKVLEIGTGSGFFAALLAARAEWVRTMEIESELVKFASDNLARNGVENVVVAQGDGMAGWAERAPYDVIVLSGGVPFVPQELLEQLKVGGRLFAFVGEAPVMKARLITCEAEGRFRTEDIFETVVPMLRNAPRHDAFSF